VASLLLELLTPACGAEFVELTKDRRPGSLQKIIYMYQCSGIHPEEDRPRHHAVAAKRRSRGALPECAKWCRVQESDSD